MPSENQGNGQSQGLKRGIKYSTQEQALERSAQEWGEPLPGAATKYKYSVVELSSGEWAMIVPDDFVGDDVEDINESDFLNG